MNSSGFWSWKSNILALASSLPVRVPFLAADGHLLTVPSHGRERELSPSSFKGTSPLGLGPTLLTSLNFTYLLEAPSQNPATFGQGFQPASWKGHHSSYCTYTIFFLYTWGTPSNIWYLFQCVLLLKGGNPLNETIISSSTHFTTSCFQISLLPIHLKPKPLWEK